MEENLQVNEETVCAATGPRESKDDDGDQSSVNETMVMTGDTSEGSSSSNLRAAAIGVHARAKYNASSAAFSPLIKVRPPPPFLLKVYDMVQDPETDSIISWNAEGTSFIIRDSHRFAAEILNKFFRHNNFSSFVCQLNTYCFKKISWDRLEFQNEWFRRGKKRWLKNIKRRNQNLQNLQQSRGASPAVDVDMFELTKEFEDLRHEHDAVMAEIKELKEWHESAEEQMAVLKKQAQCSASKQQKMARFIARAVWMLKKELHGTEVAKRRRLEWQGTESLMEIQDAGETSNKFDLENLPAQSDKQDMLLTVVLGTPNEENDKNIIYDSVTTLDVSSSVFASLEKQLMEDINCENVPKEEITKLQSRMEIELEDLIAGPAEWMEYTKELLGKARNFKPDP